MYFLKENEYKLIEIRSINLLLEEFEEINDKCSEAKNFTNL